ncbi:Predicted kinase, aminoglycoside phosphotransferase (APT) family [Sphingobium faniae]|nr:Predicted kinase, aminoglycoside phosphotransferase (APT) family [Sphingobium faniae]
MASPMINPEQIHRDSILPVGRLAEWLDAHLPGPSTRPLVQPLTGGSSNLLYLVERGGRKLVLRRPPPARYDRTSHDISREIRLLSALGQTDVPHPRLIAWSDDADLIGAPFLVMEHVDGFSPVGRFPEPFETNSAHRRDIGFRMVETLARLAKVDWRAVGLDGFGKPDGFLERQVDRWLAQFERCRTRTIPHLDALAHWLRASRPQQVATGLIHGDYSFPNVMIASDPPVRMAAIVDWESSTIGDPLLDLGHLLAGWCNPGESRTYLRDIDWRDMPTRKELVERYAELTGLPSDNIEYYRALALFKLAIILEGAYARYIDRQSDYAPHATLEQRVPALIEQAWGFALGA